MSTRHRLGSVLLAVCFLAVVTTGAHAARITDDLLFNWTFDEGEGGTAGDAAGGQDGTLYAYPTDNPQWASGLMGGALDFTPVDRVLVPHQAPLNLTGTSFTVSAWGMPDVATGNHTLFFHGQHSVVWGNWGMGIGGTAEGIGVADDGWFFFMRTGSGSGIAASVGVPFSAQDGVWTHVAATYDATPGSESLDLYIDGILAASRPGQVNMFDNTSTLQIGGDAQVSGGAARSGWDGLLDDLAIWHRALSAGEVAMVHEFGRLGTGVQDIPEPASLSLLAVGAAALLRRRRRARRP